MSTAAYIDASNLKFGVQQSGWNLDYKVFRAWLRDKFGAMRAILFMGLVPDIVTAKQITVCVIARSEPASDAAILYI